MNWKAGLKVLTVFSIGVLGVCLMYAASRLSWGQDTYKPTVITSGSMVPTISVNALVIVQSVSYDEIMVGDIITYQNPTWGSTTHRVVAKNTDYLETRGDANGDSDGCEVYPNMVYGKVVYIGNWLSPIIKPFMVNGKFNVAWAAAAISVGGMVCLWLLIFVIFLFIQAWAFVMVMTGHAYTPNVNRQLTESQNLLDAAADMNYQKGDSLGAIIRKVRTYKVLTSYLHAIHTISNIWRY